MPRKDKEKERIYNREYHKRWYQRNRGLKLEKNKAITRRWYLKNKEMLNERKQVQYSILRTEVLTHYGNGRCACVRCGFTDIRALSIDHINGGGAQDRKKVGSGVRFYKWLKDMGYPQGYQTLCMNCQFIKKHWNRGGMNEEKCNY